MCRSRIGFGWGLYLCLAVILWQVSCPFSEGSAPRPLPDSLGKPDSLGQHQPTKPPEVDETEGIDDKKPMQSPRDTTTLSGLPPEHEFQWLEGFATGEVDRLEREALDELLKSVEKEGGETAEEFKARMKAQQEITEKYETLKKEIQAFFNELKKEPITPATLEKIYAKIPEWKLQDKPYWFKHSLFPEKP